MRRQAKSIATVQRNRARNRAALVLFGRSVVITLSVVSAIIGFLAGNRVQASTYDPNAYAIGVATLFAVACAVIAYLLIRRRALRRKVRKLEAQVEELSDRSLGAARSRRARAQPVGRAGRPHRAARRPGPHHLCQRRVLRARRPQTRRADRQDERSAGARTGRGDGARRRHPHPRPEDRKRRRRALDRLARSGGAHRKRQRGAGRRPRRNRPRRSRAARSNSRATRRKPPTAPNRASSPPSATRSARRSTACSAWPTFCSTPRSRPSSSLTSRRRKPRAKRCCR